MDQLRNPLEIDVSGADVVAFVSSDRPGVQQWTELAIFYLPGADGRCFVARTEGLSRVEGQTTRRRAIYVGSMDRALGFFDAGDLANSVYIQAGDWLERNGHSIGNDIAAAQAAERGRKVHAGAPRGYTGSTLLGAVAWLYGDAQAGKAARLAEDFGVPRRTVAHALDQEQGGSDLTGWSRAFVSALMHFDRDAFHAMKGGA